MRKGFLRYSLVTLSIVVFAFYALQFSALAVEADGSVSLDTDAVTLYLGDNASAEDKYYQFEATLVGMDYSPLLWELSDYTYATVDQNGLVTLKDVIPKEADEVVITLTVKTVFLNKSDTAQIFIEMEPPQSAVRLPAMTKEKFAEIYKEPTLAPPVSAVKRPAMTKEKFAEMYKEPTFAPPVSAVKRPAMTKEKFAEMYKEPTFAPPVSAVRQPAMTKEKFAEMYKEPTFAPPVSAVRQPAMTKEKFAEMYKEPTFEPPVSAVRQPAMTKEKFAEIYKEPTYEPLVPAKIND